MQGISLLDGQISGSWDQLVKIHDVLEADHSSTVTWDRGFESQSKQECSPIGVVQSCVGTDLARGRAPFKQYYHYQLSKRTDSKPAIQRRPMSFKKCSATKKAHLHMRTDFHENASVIRTLFRRRETYTSRPNTKLLLPVK
jgi:hypothetical protein